MEQLHQFKRGGRKKLVVYLTAGFPNRTVFLELIEAVTQAGADAIEIGVPFSDPVADGPTIQLASQAALDAGIDSLEAVAELTAQARTRTAVPLIWMGYLNPFLHHGLETGVRWARDAGVTGFILPDLPLEEARPLTAVLRDMSAPGQKLCWIPLLASTTRDDRAAAMLRMAPSFAYYVSIKGVTGSRDSYPEHWEQPLRRIRALGRGPIFVGFGVSGPALARQCVSEADGVIIGSKVLELVMQNPGSAARTVHDFLRSIRSTIDG